MNSDEERSHRNGVAQFSYGALFCVIVAALIVGGLITNASKIMDAIWLMRTDNAESTPIPYFSVKLHNNGTESISLSLQGQCLLWPPEPHSWDYECGYEFKQTDSSDINSDTISVPGKSERDFLIHVKKTAPIHQTKTSLARFLSSGDWHIQFIAATGQYGRTTINSSRIPFTVDAMSSGYLFKVYRKPHRREFSN